MKTILIIEDNDDIRENVAEILMLSDYKVLMATNGKEGILMADTHRPDLIICDIMMPGVDGYDVLDILHKEPATQNIPFIFLTSKSERSDFRTAMEMGADDYITKPFAGNELLNAIESRFRKMDILKRQLSPDLEGLSELMATVGGQRTLEELTSESNINSYKKREVVFKEGSVPHFLYYVIKGKVKTFKTHEDGKQLVIDLYNRGDFMGYVALLEGAEYKVGAECMEDTELALIPRKDFEDLMNSSPDISRRFVGLLARHLADKEKQLLGIAYNTLRKKVAESLISLAKKYHANRTDPFVIGISRDELAAIAGTATESLIRTLSDFKGEHLIDIKVGKVVITDIRKLETLIR